jgi:hypothetical protein
LFWQLKVQGKNMLSKCANPQCTEPFHYLREGKLFQIDSRTVAGPTAVSGKKQVHRIEYFWLCGVCAETLTLSFDPGKDVITKPLAKGPVHFSKKIRNGKATQGEKQGEAG